MKIKGPDNPTCLCFCSRARVIAHAILQVSVRVCVGWCGLVCVRSGVLVGMCRQRCALIVARCAYACACMPARVNAYSSTVGLDLTTSSGYHRARPNDTSSLVVCCANFRFHPALTCESAVRPSALRQFWQGSRSCRCTKSSHTKTGAHSLAFFPDSAAKVSKSRRWTRLTRQCDAGRRLARAAQNGSPDFELRLPRTGRALGKRMREGF